MSWDYGCEKTGKRRYASLDDAAEAVRKVRSHGKPQRPYRCKHCNGYHLTKMLHETRPKSWYAKHHPTKQRGSK